MFEAFNERVKRRLQEMQRTADHDLKTIANRMAAKGLGKSGPRIKAQLDAIDAHMREATDWALAEAGALPPKAKDIKRMMVLPNLTENLNGHLDRLYDLVNGQLWGEIGEAVKRAMAERHVGARKTLNGELADYSQGIWRPRSQEATGRRTRAEAVAKASGAATGYDSEGPIAVTTPPRTGEVQNFDLVGSELSATGVQHEPATAEGMAAVDNDARETLLEMAMRVRADLNASKKTSIKSLYDEFPELWEILVLELNDSGGQGAGPGLSKSLGVNVSLLNRFVKQSSKPVSMKDARLIADRIVTYLRTNIDRGNTRPDTSQPILKDEREPPKAKRPRPQRKVKTIEWVVVVRTDELQAKIDHLSELMDDVMRHVSFANLPRDERALTDAEREHLIALLKTALAMLQAPMVEKGLLEEVGQALRTGALKATEKGTESVFAFVAGMAAGKIAELVSLVF